MSNIEALLTRIGFEKTGRYENKFYIIKLEDSNDFAKAYTKLDKNTINTEYPNFGVTTNNSTVKVTNYFEIEEDNITYNIFLIADFDKDQYYVKIGEKI